jgi:hypothetical protein
MYPYGILTHLNPFLLLYFLRNDDDIFIKIIEARFGEEQKDYSGGKTIL